MHHHTGLFKVSYNMQRAFQYCNLHTDIYIHVTLTN